MVKRRKTAASALRSLSIAELQTLLDGKVAKERKRLPALERKRADLAARLEEIEAAITAIRGSAPSRGRAGKKRGRKPGRPARKTKGTIRSKRGGKTTIPAAIHQVLEAAGKPMRSIEIRKEILRLKLIKGVKKSFPMQVSHALSAHKEFKKKGRGLYAL